MSMQCFANSCYSRERNKSKFCDAQDGFGSRSCMRVRQKPKLRTQKKQQQQNPALSKDRKEKSNDKANKIKDCRALNALSSFPFLWVNSVWFLRVSPDVQDVSSRLVQFNQSSTTHAHPRPDWHRGFDGGERGDP